MVSRTCFENKRPEIWTLGSIPNHSAISFKEYIEAAETVEGIAAKHKAELERLALRHKRELEKSDDAQLQDIHNAQMQKLQQKHKAELEPFRRRLTQQTQIVEPPYREASESLEQIIARQEAEMRQLLDKQQAEMNQALQQKDYNRATELLGIHNNQVKELQAAQKAEQAPFEGQLQGNKPISPIPAQFKNVLDPNQVLKRFR